MLTETEYNDLWTYSPNRIGSFSTLGIAQPIYNEYVTRENMFEDYLDVFRGINTRGIRPNIPAIWYYPHPFFNQDGTPKLDDKPCIKYVMIAEAPPQIDSETGILKYLYRSDIRGGAYITAPLRAFNHNPDRMSQVQRLLALAEIGVLILDLFPFAINYGTHRANLNLAGINIDFLISDINIYSIHNRINSLIDENLFCKDFNNNNRINTCLIAPPITSHFLADYLNHNPFYLNIRFNHNTFLIPNIHPIPFAPLINVEFIPNELIGIFINYNLINDSNGHITRVPYYCCCCYNETRGENPRALLIKNALGLP